MNEITVPLLFMNTVRHESIFAMTVDALGTIGLFIPLLGLLLFAEACILVFRSRRPAVIRSFLVFIPLPFLIGILLSLGKLISIFLVMELTYHTVRMQEFYGALSSGIIPAFVGLIFMMPPYLVISIGLFWRTVRKVEDD